MEKKALKFRKMISERVKFEDFKTMAGGCVRKTMVKIVKGALRDTEDFTKEEIEQYAYITFQESIIEDKVDYRMIIDFVSDVMKVNILVKEGAKTTVSDKYAKSVLLRKDGDKIFSTK
jgi:hypothetical protein